MMLDIYSNYLNYVFVNVKFILLFTISAMIIVIMILFTLIIKKNRMGIILSMMTMTMLSIILLTTILLILKSRDVLKMKDVDNLYITHNV